MRLLPVLAFAQALGIWVADRGWLGLEVAAVSPRMIARTAGFELSSFNPLVISSIMCTERALRFSGQLMVSRATGVVGSIRIRSYVKTILLVSVRDELLPRRFRRRRCQKTPDDESQDRCGSCRIDDVVVVQR